MTLPKKSLLLILAGIVLMTLIVCYFIYRNHKIITKSLEFNGCKAQYLYSSDDFAKENARNGGHGRHNDFNLFDAKQQIALYLCEQYINTKDPKSKEFILTHFNSESFMMHKYFWLVLCNYGQIDSLCKYKEEIFKDSSDQKIIPLCSQYEITHNSSLKNKILQYYQNKDSSFYVSNNYYEILLKIDEQHPIPTPPIDTLCKYRNDLFYFSMYIYND